MDGEENAEQPPAEMEAMEAVEGMDGMEGAMEAMDGMEGAMEAAMEPEAASPSQIQDDGEPAMEETAGQSIADFRNDERMRLFIDHCAEALENFKEDQHWTDEHYTYVNDFLTDEDQKCIFMWNSFDDEKKLRVSNVSAPQFYGENISVQDYQVAYFMKKKSM
jgi:bisphosphoglycerate-independent phosphoglycerate mutase (AlkP superfamily)